jgi:hypothetical protein
MFNFQHAPARRSGLRALGEPQDRLSVGTSILLIAGSSLLAWALFLSAVIAVRAYL